MNTLINGMILIGYCWYNGRSCIGVVLCMDTTTNKKKSYIHTVSGNDLETDLIEIISYGSSIEVEIASQMIENRGEFIN